MEATRTYLELSRESQFRPGFGAFPDLVIERVERPTPELYRECYRTVGEAYHWRDRWDWTDAEIRAHLAQPEITLHVARRRGALVGGTSCVGCPRTARSNRLLRAAPARHRPRPRQASPVLRSARRLALGPSRVWLHTCTLDHPAALPNYKKRGFQVYKTEVYEVT